jgi:hypothetical protein
LRQKVLSLAVAVVVGVALVSASGAATTQTQKVNKINVSTRAAVIHYLRSIHVNAKHAVIQRGFRNYAGAHCPGKHWTCAGTKHTVVQIAKRGGLNRFACRTAKCSVVQLARTFRGLKAAGRGKPPKPPTNTALCVKTTGITQSCVINQPNASGQNKAVVWMVTPKLTGLTQSSSYTASITQGPTSATGSSNANLVCVRQSVWLDGSTTKTNATSTTVTNDNHEAIFIQQNSLTGSNTVEGAKPANGTFDCDETAPLTQDEQLTSVVTTKGSITQKQDTATSGSANVVVDIEQNQDINGFSGFFGNASGVNNAAFKQSINHQAVANTTTGKIVTQTQGADVPDPPFSGGVGTINQHSSSQSTAIATQIETQCEDAINTSLTPAQSSCDTNDPDAPTGITLTQTQYGPEGVLTAPKHSTGRVPYYHKGYGASEQTGNDDCIPDDDCDVFTLHQTSTQNNDDGPHTTQANIIQGDCVSNGGSCEATQTATLNGDDTKDGYTAPSITDSNTLIINCSNGHASCTATPPPAPTITAHPTDPSEDTNPAFAWNDAATNGVSFDCKIDTGDPASCDSGDTFPVGLGPHTFAVTASDNFGNTSDAASFGWTVVPYLTFEWTDDGAAAGWTGGVPGSSITLTVGSLSATTFGQFSLHNFEGIAIGDLAEPTFTTNAYSGGVPREEIDFSNGDYVFGYPSQAGDGADSWQLVCDGGCVGDDGFMSWGDVQTVEGNLDATVAAALVEADGGVPDGSTYVISDFTFGGFDLSDFTNHWHNG